MEAVFANLEDGLCGAQGTPWPRLQLQMTDDTVLIRVVCPEGRVIGFYIIIYINIFIYIII